MANYKKDALDLVYSSNFDISGLKEEQVNLELNPTTHTSTTLFGTVTDESIPVENATVKVFDNEGNPFEHIITDSLGNYIFEGLPAGSYTVAVVKDGYLLSQSRGAVLTEDLTVELDFAITRDTTLSLGAVAGILLVNEGDTSNPLANGKITLYDTEQNIVAVTYSADDGEFAFYDISSGDYTVVASATGYVRSSPMAVTISDNTIINIELYLEVDTRTYNGTVNGTIRDENGNIVVGCFVGLYQRVTDQQGKTREKLVSVTKTNASGRYLFGDVHQGDYVVKAKMNQ